MLCFDSLNFFFCPLFFALGGVLFAGCKKRDPNFQQVGAMAFASGLGNRDLKEQPGARSSRIRSAKAEGSWILSSSLYDQLVEGSGNAQPLYNVLEHLASKDTVFQHHPKNRATPKSSS